MDKFGQDILARCQWASNCNDGHPDPAWSTREQLAVALVLSDRLSLDHLGYTPIEAAHWVRNGMSAPPPDFPAWLKQIRAALREMRR